MAEIPMLSVDFLVLRGFIYYVTAKKPIPPFAKDLLLLAAWYSNLREETRKEGRLISDIKQVAARKFRVQLTGITDREYEQFINELALYEATANYDEWEKLHPLREQIDYSLKHDAFDPSEKEHFAQERYLLGDAGEDIAGRVIDFMPEQPQKRKHKKRK